MIKVSDLKVGMKIIYNADEYDSHFLKGGIYEVFCRKQAFPYEKELERPDALLIWCEEVSIHYIENLKLEQWDIYVDYFNAEPIKAD